jgi:uncharacterized protein (UPF0305 family)
MSKYKLLRYNTNKGCYFKIKKRHKFLWFITYWTTERFCDFEDDDLGDCLDIYSRIDNIDEAYEKLHALQKYTEEEKEYIVSIDEL